MAKNYHIGVPYISIPAFNGLGITCEILDFDDKSKKSVEDERRNAIKAGKILKPSAELIFPMTIDNGGQISEVVELSEPVDIDILDPLYAAKALARCLTQYGGEEKIDFNNLSATRAGVWYLMTNAKIFLAAGEF